MIYCDLNGFVLLRRKCCHGNNFDTYTNNQILSEIFMAWTVLYERSSWIHVKFWTFRHFWNVNYIIGYIIAFKRSLLPDLCSFILNKSWCMMCWVWLNKLLLGQIHYPNLLNMSHHMTKPTKWHDVRPDLIRVFAVCMKKAWVLSYPLSA